MLVDTLPPWEFGSAAAHVQQTRRSLRYPTVGLGAAASASMVFDDEDDDGNNNNSEMAGEGGMGVEATSTHRLVQNLALHQTPFHLMKASLFSDEYDDGMGAVGAASAGGDRYGHMGALEADYARQSARQHLAEMQHELPSSAGPAGFGKAASGSFFSPRVPSATVAPATPVTNTMPATPSIHLAMPPPTPAPRRPVAATASLLTNRQDVLADAGLMMGRSFRVGWGPNGTLVHIGKRMGGGGGGGDKGRLTSLLGGGGGVGSTESTGSSDSTVHIERVTVAPHLAAEMGPHALEQQYSRMLDIHLRYSVREGDKKNDNDSSNVGSPFYHLPDPTAAVQAVKQHAQQQGSPSSAPAVQSQHARMVWELVDALWGAPNVPASSEAEVVSAALAASHGLAPYERAVERRRALTRWLANTARQSPMPKQPLTDAVNSTDDEEALRAIFAALTEMDLAAAARKACSLKDYRLATLISQAAGPQRVRNMVREQLALWLERGSKAFVNKWRLRIFALLAGTLVWPDRSEECVVTASLDWKRAFAVHLWYGCAASAEAGEGLARFEQAFTTALGDGSGAGVAAPPHPPYKEAALVASGVMPPAPASSRPPAKHFDTCYHLLQLFCDRSHSLEHLLLPRNSVPHVMDYRLSWSLYVALEGLGFQQLPPRRRHQLCTDFAAQLEHAGLWHWAIFVLQHLEAPAARERMIRDVLCRACEVQPRQAGEYRARVEFVVGTLGVSAEWVHEATALRALYEGKDMVQAQELIAGGVYDKAHEVVSRSIARELIISGDYARLEALLVQLEAGRASISGWGEGGGVWLDYLRVLSQLRMLSQGGAAGGAMEEVAAMVDSLCLQLGRMQMKHPRDRLCNAEMAVTLAVEYEMLFTRGRGGGPGALSKDEIRFPGILRKLPVPENYAYPCLTRLTGAYLQSLNA